MKTTGLLLGMTLLGSAAFGSFAADEQGMDHAAMHHNMHDMGDSRTSLNLSPQMKRHQLSNMRSHVEAVQSIVGLVADGDFDQASRVAHEKLGMTDEMKKMCVMFENPDFMKLGLAFHKSADELGDVLATKDANKSLRALHDTMEHCVKCHATFRQ